MYQPFKQGNMSDKYKSVSCMGYDIFSDDLAKIEYRNKLIINTINQYSFCIAEENNAFKQSLLNSDILLPDGIGITAAVKLFTGKKIKKIAGADIHKFLLNEADQDHASCFYLGSNDETLEKITDRVNIEYPHIKVGAYSPPYKEEFTDGDNEIILRLINEFKPEILFIGMTAPKQEKWTYTFKDQINANIICSIGAVFDFYAGTIKRPSRPIINLGLEWLWRLIKEPRRLWKRYLYYGPVFLYKIFKAKFSSGN